MKTIRRMALPAVLAATFFAGCSKDNDETPAVDGKCFADKISLTHTQTNDASSQHTVLITFDAKNTSTEGYDIAKGHSVIYVKLSATTADNKTYTEDTPLTATSLDAGATASVTLMVDYGAGNTFKSYKVEQVYCK